MLSDSFATVFSEINELIQDKQPITINHSSFNLEFCLGGDYSQTSIIQTSIIRTIRLSRLFSLVPIFS